MDYSQRIGPKSTLYPSQEGIDGIKGAVSVDGVDACVREVRKQIGAGADWIKVGIPRLYGILTGTNTPYIDLRRYLKSLESLLDSRFSYFESFRLLLPFTYERCFAYYQR